ncbi:MAG: Gfo/Idh/MocA family oxidoreductase [Thermoguttaceae bacterium]|nr:Gfo/Idh/MocA family oxidoreductase [Thermoguttaceae bacterium]MDW8077725.1 Gfo/Idh/MocA family oxidoreductase [Thermoguttaceae bacterium]
MRRSTIALLSVLVSLGGLVSTTLGQSENKPKEIIRAGIIGLDTSHAIAFTQIINDPKAEGVLAEVEVVAAYPNGVPDNPYSWNRVGQYTEQIRKMGVRICESIPELLGQVDVVLLETVDGRPHLEQARPVIAAGKRMFIDKPMAASLADVLEIFRLAREAKVPVWSSSSLRFSSGFQAARRGESFGKVLRCVAWSPMHLEEHHPDLFWYGVHGVETLFTIMGPGCEVVERPEQGKVIGYWKDGRVGIFEARDGYGAEVEGTAGKGSAGKYEGYKPLVVEICNFFKTGVVPVDEAETIEIFAFMEAADESKRRGGEKVSLAEVLEKARQFNEARRQSLTK